MQHAKMHPCIVITTSNETNKGRSSSSGSPTKLDGAAEGIEAPQHSNRSIWQRHATVEWNSGDGQRMQEGHETAFGQRKHGMDGGRERRGLGEGGGGGGGGA